ncbi:hypothetical protein CAPTEDRAFT_218725 [Capitella teleta]|uniref:Replication protein A C-terminal domain-containing protein n=1 Tax=Capitella teleta TaxID=283909 RepID=X2ANQ0_CAPTE|nr:hypothetical protein CAPTEDRAFT_218725 [Capitella teleta]|eukprot:ELT90082.1 hypothetical protein CAPTEDRAFT_218725 [Capitella teleta]
MVTKEVVTSTHKTRRVYKTLKEPKTRAQNVIPVTVAQVLAAQQNGDNLIWDEIELHQVSILGIVRSVNENPTRLEYFIDDLTARPLEVRQFVDADENAPEDKTDIARENQYVQVFGTIRDFQGKRSINAFKILQVADANTITTHLLEVIHAHLALKKAKIASEAGSWAQTAEGYSNATSNPPAAMSFGSNHMDQGLTPTQAQVHNVIRACSEDQGMSVHTITDNLRGIPQKAIRDAIEFLSAEGHIYSTVDDEHYRSTDSV